MGRPHTHLGNRRLTGTSEFLRLEFFYSSPLTLTHFPVSTQTELMFLTPGVFLSTFLLSFFFCSFIFFFFRLFFFPFLFLSSSLFSWDKQVSKPEIVVLCGLGRGIGLSSMIPLSKPAWGNASSYQHKKNALFSWTRILSKYELFGNQCAIFAKI